MTTFWFLFYIAIIIASLVAGGMAGTRSGVDGEVKFEISDWILGGFTGIILLPLLALGYHAGIFYHFTGYEGTTGWFTFWITLSLVSLAYSMLKYGAWYGAIWLATMFVIYQMDGLGQLTNIF